MDSNWYVIYVKPGEEKKIAWKCRSLIDGSVLHAAFTPVCRKKMQLKGQWKITETLMYPGYVFLETDDILAVNRELINIPEYTKLLGKENGIIYPLTLPEKESLQSILNTGYVAEESTGYKKGKTITVESGPLKGRENDIIKIDRHKRRAYVKTGLCGKNIVIEMGLELIGE